MWFRIVLLIAWLGTAGAFLLWGLDYYLLPQEERAYSSLHTTFSATGLVGQGLGIIGTLMIVTGVILYTARKRIRWMARLGSLKRWLEFHIFLCTLGPFLVLLHTTFKFGGIVSIAFWSMVLVVLSGVFGRYVYVRIPKTIQGGFLDLRELESRRERILEAVVAATGLAEPALVQITGAGARVEPRGFIHALVLAARHDLTGRARRRKIRRALKTRSVPSDTVTEVVRLLVEETKLEQRITLLEPFRRMFRYWHAFHLPLAAVMVLILAVHVTVAVLFGYTWVF